MLSCKESTHLLSEAEDRPLGFAERLALKMHLLMCKGCTNYQQQLDFLRHACGRLKTPSQSNRHNDL